jgi:hypothetical protein
MRIYKLKIDVPTSDHNAPAFNEEIGGYYPEGEGFTMTPKKRQVYHGKILMCQIGGEETRVLFPVKEINKYFDI